MNIFEHATREKFRFPYKGLISVEDLWDLGEAQLDSIYRNLNAQKKKNDEASLLATKSAEDEVLEVKIQIVKYIFDQKRADADTRRRKVENAEKRRRLQELIANKQDAALQDKSIDELQRMLDEIE